MSSKLLYLQDIGEALPDGVTSAGQVCPFCHGGSSHEKSLSVTRVGQQVKYMCHRSSCGSRGALSVTGKPIAQSMPRSRLFVTDPDELPQEHRDYLKDTYYLQDNEIDRGEWGWTDKYSPAGKGRVYMPILDYLGKRKGYSCRDLYKQQTPKCLVFMFRDDTTKLAWYYTGKAAPLVLVEDQTSALRLSTYYSAAALHGTYLAEDMIDEIRRVPSGPVYLCLDKDATSSAIKQTLKWRGRLGKPLKTVPLSRDIKDLTRQELDVWIRDNIT